MLYMVLRGKKEIKIRHAALRAWKEGHGTYVRGALMHPVS